MRSGVEKLRFVSSRTGRRLPTITISMGVAEISAKEKLNALTHKASSATEQAKQAGKNTVIQYLD